MMSPLSWSKMLVLGLAAAFLAACQLAPGGPVTVAPTSTVEPTAAGPSATPAPTVGLAAPSPEAMTEEAVPRITAESLKARLDAGQEVVIVDTRSLENFREKHIAGAVSIPLLEIDVRRHELPKDKAIVLYCT